MSKQSEILSWFENDRSFEKGKDLFNRHGSNLSLKTMLNRQGNTPYNFKLLCYELAKAAGISEARYKAMLQVPAKTEIREAVKVDINTLSAEDIFAKINEIDINELKDNNKIKAVVKLTGLKPESQRKPDLIAVIGKAKSNKIISEIPDEVKKAFRLRDEFPFLKTKECPGALKELVADMITTHEKYVEGHQQLNDDTDPELIKAISQSVVENYLENRQIWDELNHFKTTGKILGKHPIFEWMTRRDEIQALKTPELVKLKDQLENNIPRTKKKITDEPEHKDTAKRQARVDQFEKELILVKQLLNL